jgi:hypothetical protein
MQGVVYACGSSENGRLGTNKKDHHENIPIELSTEVFHNEKIIQINAGCTHSIALSESGTVYTWGRNEKGQLGIGSDYLDVYSMEWEPQKLNKSVFEGKKVIKVVAGKDRCAAVTEDGKLYTWGHKFMHYPTQLQHPKEGVKVIDVGLAGKDCTAYITNTNELWTAGSSSSLVLGRQSGGMFDDAIQRVISGLEGRHVLEIFTGFGQHMAARVTSVIE